MNQMSDWEQTTLRLRVQMEAELVQLHGRILELEKGLESLDILIKQYRERFLQPQSESARVELTRDDVTNKTQREIIELIASRNDGFFNTKTGIPLMKQLGVFGNPANASAMVWRVLSRPNSKFERVSPGLYRLQKHGEGVPRVVRSGLVEKVREIRQSNPNMTRTQIANALVTTGYDFQGKHPAFAVSAAWMSLERERKRNMDSEQPKLIAMK